MSEDSDNLDYFDVVFSIWVVCFVVLFCITVQYPSHSLPELDTMGTWLGVIGMILAILAFCVECLKMAYFRLYKKIGRELDYKYKVFLFFAGLSTTAIYVPITDVTLNFIRGILLVLIVIVAMWWGIKN